MVVTASIETQSGGNGSFEDITDAVAERVLQSGLDAGIVTIFTPSATSALTTIEYEAGCLRDFGRLFDDIAGADLEYSHNLRWGDGNGHSHIRAALLGPSLTIPFVNGRLTLGTWQQVVFADFDNRTRRRRLVLQIMGDRRAG